MDLELLVKLGCIALGCYIGATVVSVIILIGTSYKTLKDGF
jgi:hypothetical protein